MFVPSKLQIESSSDYNDDPYYFQCIDDDLHVGLALIVKILPVLDIDNPNW